MIQQQFNSTFKLHQVISLLEAYFVNYDCPHQSGILHRLTFQKFTMHMQTMNDRPTHLALDNRTFELT